MDHLSIDPALPQNQFSVTEGETSSENSSYAGAYAQIIVTVTGDDVIDELMEIENFNASIESHYLMGTNESFANKLYLFRLKAGLNPKNYLNFLNQYPGVVRAELDQIIGIASD